MIRLFGTTISETARALHSTMHLGEKETAPSKDDKIKAWGRLIVSILLIGFAVYSFVSGSKEVGGTVIGAVTGYWLK